MKYSVVLFDLDGTLTDSKPGIINSIQYALNALNLPIPANIDTMLGPPLWKSFVEICGVAEDAVDDAVAKYREYFNAKGMFENSVYDGIGELLACLQKAGLKLAVATSKPEFYAKQILEHFDLAHYFTTIAGSEMDGTRSEKAEVIAYALENFRGATSVMIGDRKHDILGAKACQIDSIGVIWGYGSRDELHAAAPTHLASNTNELYNIICS